MAQARQTTVALRPIEIAEIQLTIRGISPMIQHQWSDKAKTMIREKQQLKKTKTREARDPEHEMEEATYRTLDGSYGISVTAIKSALITAAHKDTGIEKTLVRKALFIPCEDASGVLAMNTNKPVMREDCVRVGQGSADLRYRPEFREWSVELKIQYDTSLLNADDIVNLVNRAGFGVGIGDWRPEKGGDFGRFEVLR